MSQHLESKQAAETSATTTSHRPDRRHSMRGGVHGEPSRAHLIALTLGTYREMPRLSLHLHQAARLFGPRERRASSSYATSFEMADSVSPPMAITLLRPAACVKAYCNT